MKQVTRQTYGIFWEHARRYRLLVLLMALGVVGASAARLTVPILYKRFFDTLSAASPGVAGAVAELTAVVALIALVEVVGWIFHRTEAFVANYFQPRVMTDLANTCFQYLHRHSYGFFANQFVGALVRRVNRLIDAFEGVTDRLFSNILPIVLRIGAIVVIVSIRHPLLGAMLAVWVFLFAVANYAFSAYKLRYDVAAAHVNSAVTGRLADTLTNHLAIKTFTGLRRESNAFGRLTGRQFRAWWRAHNVSEIMTAVQAALMVAIEFLVFFFAVRLWHRGLVTIGDFALLQAYLLQVFERMWDFGRVLQRMYKYLADAEEMVEILHEPHEVRDKPRARALPVRKGAIAFRGVRFNYHHTRSVLEDFNLVVRSGEKVGIVGFSGAGKSTLAALALRFYDVTAGQIGIDGVNIADVTQESLRAAIAYVPQEPLLFHRTIMENIRYGRFAATDEEVHAAARLAHADEFIVRLPRGYETFVGERGIKLSGGERQRIAIARAILKNAPILILDEATSSLDSRAEAAIQDALVNLMRGKTAIVIAHRLSTIMRMDRIVVMQAGRIAEAGTHRELIARRDGLYARLWSIQAGGFIA